MKSSFASVFGKLHFKFLIRSIFVLVIGVVGFEAMTFYQMSEMIRDLTLKNMRSSVEVAASKIDDELSRLKTDLEIISSLPALEAFYLNLEYGLESEARQYKSSLESFFNRQSSRNNAYVAFRICDRNQNTLSLYSKKQALQSNITNHPCFSDQATFSQKYMSSHQLSSKPILINSQKIFRDNQVIGTIEIFFDLSAYFALVESYPIYESGFLSVIDSNGLSLSTSDKKRLDLQRLAQSFQNANNQSHPLFSISSANEKIIVYRSRLNEIDWSIFAFVFEDEIFAPLYFQIKLTILLIAAMIVTEILFLSFFTKRLITNRINLLVNATRSILAGNYELRLSEKGDDEISELSASFNRMTGSLEEQLFKLKIERENLSKSKQQLQDIIDNSSAIISIKDIEGKYLLINNAYKDFMKISNEQVIGKTDHEIHDQSKADLFRKNDQEVLKTGKSLHFEEESRDYQGNKVTFITVKFPLTDSNGNVYGTCGIATDISTRIAEEQALQKLNAKLTLSNTVLENIIEGVVITDATFSIIDINPAFVQLFGYRREELIGQKPSILRSEIHDQNFFDELYQTLEVQGNWHGEIWEKTKNGAVLPQLLTVTSLRNADGEITHYAGIYSDITDLKQTEAELQKLAHFDSLTGLANRLLLEERTSQAILRAQRSDHKVTMLFIDLDNFKYINDTLGHDIGDRLLKLVAKRFGDLLRDTDTLARLGGDEFVVLLAKTVHADDARIIASKIKAAGSLPFQVDEHELYISTSIGIAVYPDDAESTNGLLKCADMAMYAAKDTGKNNFQFFSAKLNHAAVDRLKTEKALRAAITNDELELYYQPQVNVQKDSTIKAEALLRWQHDGQFIPPDLFIPIAEESGFIVVLGEWIVAQAIRDLNRINQNRKNKISISINLSARQFRHHDLAQKLHQIVADAGVSPQLIEFEVTEGLLIDDFKLAETILHEIRQLGFTIALDDFGKGYSSLSYLKHFPIDTLKLDRTFMGDVIADPRTQAIIKAAVELGQALGMQVVFEGVETEEQYQFVKSIGDVNVQGYYCSKVLPVPEFIDYLERQQNATKKGG